MLETREVWLFTGSRSADYGFTASELSVAAAQLGELPDDAVVMTGGAIGLDSVINRRAAELGLPRINVLPSNTAQTDFEAIAGSRIVQTRLGAPERDRLMVKNAQHCRAIAVYEPARQPRSGTYLTAREAQKKGILERLVILRPVGWGDPAIFEGEICVCHPTHCPCAHYQRRRTCSCSHHGHELGVALPTPHVVNRRREENDHDSSEQGKDKDEGHRLVLPAG